ncbi:DsbA family oxidoreductase [Cellulophaga baltica]|uniref:DsbA family oxidoreductase n=1 Tax=Cellulophaga baltica TaxID=76594 RepID=UPI00040FAB5B|nr:DsbA family oxidoreductase [Cellulophaga baltica]AIY12802.1 DSBA oxidoreductase [Cellulophaga baltica NN016038]MCR1023355.1 DsbA family oxidoreductase [Cellulophaga baltica]
MEINIWSDIRCPFCYIGKRKFEAALVNFPHKDQITVHWKSFELDPNLETKPEVDYTEYFIEHKNVDRDSALGMFNNVTAMAREVGLAFNIKDGVIANSLNAHRLLHYAKKEGYADATKEALLKAQLVDAENIDDKEHLIALAKAIGMDGDAVREMLNSDDYTYEVRQDELEARNLGINGVPFFVLDHKYGISGAQPTEVFAEALDQAWKKHNEEKLTILPVGETGGSCDVDGNCS